MMVLDLRRAPGSQTKGSRWRWCHVTALNGALAWYVHKDDVRAFGQVDAAEVLLQ